MIFDQLPRLPDGLGPGLRRRLWVSKGSGARVLAPVVDGGLDQPLASPTAAPSRAHLKQALGEAGPQAPKIVSCVRTPLTIWGDWRHRPRHRPYPHERG